MRNILQVSVSFSTTPWCKITQITEWRGGVNHISEGFKSLCSYCIYKRRHELLSVRAINVLAVAWRCKYVDQGGYLLLPFPFHGRPIDRFWGGHYACLTKWGSGARTEFQIWGLYPLTFLFSLPFPLPPFPPSFPLFSLPSFPFPFPYCSFPSWRTIASLKIFFKVQMVVVEF